MPEHSKNTHTIKIKIYVVIKIHKLKDFYFLRVKNFGSKDGVTVNRYLISITKEIKDQN